MWFDKLTTNGSLVCRDRVFIPEIESRSAKLPATLAHTVRSEILWTRSGKWMIDPFVVSLSNHIALRQAGRTVPWTTSRTSNTPPFGKHSVHGLNSTVDKATPCPPYRRFIQPSASSAVIESFGIPARRIHPLATILT